MSASIPSCTGLSCVICVKEGKKSWEANRHRVVFLVGRCRDWRQGLGLRWITLPNPRLHWAEIQWIWRGSDGALKPINVLQMDQNGERMFSWIQTAVEDGSPQGILGEITYSTTFFLLTFLPANLQLPLFLFSHLTIAFLLHMRWIVFLQLGDTVREGSHESLMRPVHKLLRHHQPWSVLNTFASLPVSFSNDH